MFDYDPSPPLDARPDAPARDLAGGGRAEDITFVSPRGGRVTATLAIPSGEGPFPAILFMHAGQLDRTEFVDEAVSLALYGVVSLMIDAPYTRPDPWRVAIGAGEQGVDIDLHAVVDMRRSLDLLEVRSDIDPARIGYVGHSYGASLGPILLAIEASRLRTAVLMAGHPANSEFYRDSPIMAADREAAELATWRAYVRALDPLDAVRYLPRVVCPTLLQWARHDEFIGPDDAVRFTAALGDRGDARWYDSDHFFDEAARRDREAWLLKHLR
jgi:cephalosporin-C deacetylase-like acetyl esterase